MSLITKKRTKMGRKRERGEVIAVITEISPLLKQAMDMLAKRNRRTRTAEAQLAFEAHLERSGLWPPKEE
jgi:hypothetical protein